MSERPEGKYRLVTRSDFDGLVCAVLLKELDMIEEIKFVHPKDMQDGLIPISDTDITTNLPYVPGCYLAFDHHMSETIRVGAPSNYICNPEAPSASRVVFDYFGGQDKFPSVSDEMMEMVDKADSAMFTTEEILNPKDWILLNFLMDARTGLGRFRQFRISNYALMMSLIDMCQKYSISEILAHPDVRERAVLYAEHEGRFLDQLTRCSRVRGNVCVIDLREEQTIWAGNRFVVYALFPKCNVSIHMMRGHDGKRTVLAVGASIVNRSLRTNIGAMLLGYGGGGHAKAGTCQVPIEDAAESLEEIVAKLQHDHQRAA